MTRLKFNQILKFIHHLQLFISIGYHSYLIKIGLGGVRMLEVASRYIIYVARVVQKFVSV